MLDFHWHWIDDDEAGLDRGGLQMVVPDIEKAHDELAERGVAVGDIQDLAWGRFVYFSDPDGNKWAVQQVPRRG